ncbi:YdaU family protein, partial [Acinetobacter baumannii]
MNYYQHHIGDFNNATRHLSLIERAIYRDLLDMYYDTEKAIDASSIDRLARRLQC